MKMHILSGGRLRMRRSVFYPQASREETVELPVSCILLKHAQGVVLFDTGCHPQVATEAEARWGSMAHFMTPLFEPQYTLVAQLPLAGVGVDDIDVVVCSHLHVDHCGCNSFFPKATVIAHARELEAARAPDSAAQGYLPVEWDHGAIDTIDGQRDLFGDGRITLIPMPGHTPGMTTAHVVLDSDGAFLLASDAAAVRQNLVDEHAPRNSWDAALATSALAEIARIEKAGATVIFGHDDEQYRGLRKGEAFYA